MGAGSAKGANATPDDDDLENDRFSVDGDSFPPSVTRIQKLPINHHDNNSKPPTKTLAVIPGLNDDDEEEEVKESRPIPKAPPIPNHGTDPKREDKRRGLFGVPKWWDEDEKTNVFVHEEVTKPASAPRGLRFFQRKKEVRKKPEEKDERLEQEINELQRTFDSMGILGIGQPSDDGRAANRRSKSQSADDILKLEPMRNRVNAKRGSVRPMTRKGSEGIASSSEGPRRTFKYSWEMEPKMSGNLADQEWTYQSISIDGFDIEKFRRANLNDSILGSNGPGRLPNSVLRDGQDGGVPSWKYDAAEQKLLASIERDFVL